jgi:DNA-binding response OmpR family regulator
LVEDDTAIAEPLTRGLQAQGYRVAWAKTAAAARAAVSSTPPELVLLDLGLPDLDGVVLCREVRAALPRALIVILTARDAEVDIVVGLEAGADDYLVKPFGFSELLARLRAHLRRNATLTASGDDGGLGGEARVLHVGAVTLDVSARRVSIGGRAVDLRPKEFDLLATLLESAGRAVSREELMSRVWDENWYGSTKTLDMHIGMLRRRLVDAGADPAQITTLRGFGYRFETNVEREPDPPG